MNDKFQHSLQKNIVKAHFLAWHDCFLFFVMAQSIQSF